MTDTDLRDRIAKALRDDLKSRTISPPPGPFNGMIGSMGLTEFDLADAALRVVQTELAHLAAERDAVYRERAHLVAHLAAVHPSHIGYTDPDVPTWPVLTVETPTGQMCWHINPTDLDLFDHVTWVDPVAIGWDGHTTEEKYQRLGQLAAQTAAEYLLRERATCPRCNTGDRAPCGRHLRTHTSQAT